MKPTLANKVVVVTGGGRGIGREMALACAAQGAQVAIAARSESDLAEVSEELIKTGAPFLSQVCDVTSDAQVESFFAAVKTKLGDVFGLVCAAGIHGPLGPVEDASLEDWEKVFQVNVLGVVRCLKQVIPSMKSRREGRLILFSGGGQGPLPRFVPYTASKGAIARLTESLAAELAPFGIYTNAIAPGAVNTRLLTEVLEAGPQKVGESYYRKIQKLVQEGGTPANKAADLGLYLLSEKSRGLWGKILSAVWDPYTDLQDLEKLSQTDLYTNRRVVTPEGGTRA